MTTADLPSVATVLAAFRRALESPATRPAGLLGILLDLHVNNLAQWELEDTARDPAANDAMAASAKRGIDKLNLTRHHLVEQVDRLIDEAIEQTADAPPVTESPGMAFDRLSVLVIRLHYTELASGRAAPDAAPYVQRLPALREQLAWLEDSLERLLRDLRDGQCAFLPYQHLKLYRQPVEPSSPSSFL